MDDSCHICGNTSGNMHYSVREMMLGTQDLFQYFQCRQCGCLQIKTIPESLAQYYPDNYYSFKSLNHLATAKLRRWADEIRVRHFTGQPSFLGNIFNRIAKPLSYIEYIQHTQITPESNILDIGCGNGGLILRMHLGGFHNVTGIDPYLTDNLQYANGVNIYKTSLPEFTNSTQKKFDLIMMHHSLEHMIDQKRPLQDAKNLLSEHGTILVRIPLCDSYAWENYHENWVQLDAPRHLYLNTRKSFSMLAEQAGLYIDKIVYDSSAFQFTGSELYKQNIPLNSEKIKKQIFTKKQQTEFDQKALQLNAEESGDQAAFYLKHKH